MNPSSEVPAGVDHLVYAVADLKAGMDDIEQLFGVRPARGGRHPRYGTQNALLALGPQTYLEIIAADPQLPRPEQGRGFGVEAANLPRLETWALRRESIEAVAEYVEAMGISLGSVASGAREKPDGTVLTWKLSDPYACRMNGAVPFLIAWGDTPHPATSAPLAGELVSLRIMHPNPDAVRAALGAMGVNMMVEEGPEKRLLAIIQTRNKVVRLS